MLLKEFGIQVRATTVDHGLPVLAFALEERAHINIWRNKLGALGLAVGPWLRAFKEATLGGADDVDLIKVAWADAEDKKPDALPFGMLKKEIMKISSGRKIAYVVDCAYTECNIERIVKLAKGADTLFIEGGFLERDSAAACGAATSDGASGRNDRAPRRREAARDLPLLASLQGRGRGACAGSSGRVS